MRYAGEKLTRTDEAILVIPRGDTNIILKMIAIENEKDFETMCPMPTPPIRKYPDGREVPNPESPEYNKAINKWAEQRMAWVTIKSLSATEDMEWENVKLDDPETWLNYQEELKETFSQLEINLIMAKIFDVCGLSAAKIEKATEDFLARMKEEQLEDSSQTEDPNSMQSGEPVKDSE